MKRTISSRIAFIAMFIALAMILSYVEMLLPFFGKGLGLKLGLANVIVLSALYLFGEKEAFVISLVRVVLVSILFGNGYSFVYSVFGAVISLIIMIVLKLSKSFSIYAVSIAGGVFHNIGQILVAICVLGKGMIYYLPILITSGIISGLVIGIIGAILTKRVKKVLKQMFEYDRIKP